jgi:hypothetical protein
MKKNVFEGSHILPKLFKTEIWLVMAGWDNIKDGHLTFLCDIIT